MTKLPNGYDRAELVRHPERGGTAKVRLHVAGSHGYVDGPWCAAGRIAAEVAEFNRALAEVAATERAS